MINVISLFSGSSGNAFLISDGKTNILLDAGMSQKLIEESLKEAGVDGDIAAIFVTHEHIDHTRGLFPFSKKHAVPIYMTAGTSCALSRGGSCADMLRIIECGKPVFVGEFNVVPFPAPHDAAEPVGFVFEESGVRVGFATDTGCVTNDMKRALSGCDGVVIEANHDENMLILGPYPHRLKIRILSDDGHLSNDGAAELASYLYGTGTRKFMLAHLSQTNNEAPLAAHAVKNAVGADAEIVAAAADTVTKMEVPAKIKTC
ncbi:MAG: MBL fold metallo-hydrolase [Clostridia bacterium]|nr:MBL fold metallo-hydrolase [Clostridia bacterium]